MEIYRRGRVAGKGTWQIKTQLISYRFSTPLAFVIIFSLIEIIDPMAVGRHNSPSYAVRIKGEASRKKFNGCQAQLILTIVYYIISS